MTPQMNEFSYRRAAVEGTSSVGLVVMLFDRLIADVQRAARALRDGDIETRCAETKHAMLILQQLEGSLDKERGGDAVRNLEAFYSYARTQLLEAQMKGQPTILEKLVGHLVDIRGAWQQVDPARKASPSASREPEVTEARTESAALSCTV